MMDMITFILSRFDFNMQRHLKITLQRSSPSNRFPNFGELSDCSTIWNFQKNNEDGLSKACKCQTDNLIKFMIALEKKYNSP